MKTDPKKYEFKRGNILQQITVDRMEGLRKGVVAGQPAPAGHVGAYVRQTPNGWTVEVPRSRGKGGAAGDHPYKLKPALAEFAAGTGVTVVPGFFSTRYVIGGVKNKITNIDGVENDGTQIIPVPFDTIGVILIKLTRDATENYAVSEDEIIFLETTPPDTSLISYTQVGIVSRPEQTIEQPNPPVTVSQSLFTNLRGDYFGGTTHYTWRF